MVEKSKPIFGIIGGAGVAAANFLNQLIEEEITRRGAYRDAHHPEIILYQAVNVPSRSMYLEGRGESFIPGYVDIGQKLKNAGATILAMSCNTAHYALDQLQEKIGMPFIDMVELSVEEAKNRHQGKKIAIIASDGCLLGKVYEKRFQKIYPDAVLIYPDYEHQKLVTKGIVNIKNRARFYSVDHPERPKAIFKTVCNHLSEQGAELIISGCTDISVDFLPIDYPAIPIIDSLTVLKNKIVEIFLQHSNHEFYDK